MKLLSLSRIPAIKWLFTAVTLLLLSVTSFSQTFDFKTREASMIRTATQIKAHNGFADTIVVRQDKWDEMRSNWGSWGANLKFKSVHAFVKFYVNHAYPKKVTDPYTLRLTYKVLGFGNMADTNSFATTFDTLTISYKSDSLAAFQDMQYKKYSNYHKIMVIMTGLYKIDGAGGLPVPVNMSSAGSFNQLNFNVEGSILVQPFHKKGAAGGSYVDAYGSDAPALKMLSAPLNDNLQLFWNIDGGSLPGTLELTPANYELEWTYIDNYKVSANGTVTTKGPDELSYNFKNNSTKVWLDTNYYQIPLIYQQGHVVYRVRMVRPDSVYYRYPVYGKWNVADNGLVASVNTGNRYSIGTAHLGDSLNWQYTVSFAEQGKYKQVMSYYDGMLKNRQSITRFNSMPGKLIATEQVYDYEGRPSISILPTPINTYGFKYQFNVSLNAVTTNPYKAADFDAISLAICPADVLPSPLALGAKANQYYSPSNPDQAGFQKFVPDAGGYPFVQTIYSAGYDERVEKQGGAGDSLQIGRRHTIKNNYVSAEQMDLNRLFGLDIGWSGFYRKTVSKDPNGQYSLNVTDYHGKTVTSSMIGIPDTSIHAITMNTNVPDTTLYTEDFIAGTQQQIYGNRRILDKLIFNDAAGNNTAQYIYSYRPFPTFCQGKFLSVKAKYDYRINDECGTLVTKDSATLGTTGVTTSGAIQTSNSAINSFYMEQGQQSLHKELTVKMTDIYAAVDSFIGMNHTQNCLRTEQDFIKEEVLARQFPCPEDLEHMACPSCGSKEYEMMQELWPNKDSIYLKRKYGIYNKNTGVVLGNNNSIFTLLCHKAPSGNNITITDHSIRTVISSSGVVSGFGNETNGNYTLVERPLGNGVFVTSGTDTLQCHYRYQDTCLVHLPASITKFGHTYNNLQSLPVDTFIYLFNDSIAQSLLPLHPEYCHLLDCVDDYFAKKLKSIPDGRTALAMGMLQLSEMIHADPLFTALQQQPSLFPNAFDTLAYWPGGLMSLDTIALAQAYCNCSDSAMFNQCFNNLFNTQIHSFDLSDPFVRNKYFTSIRTLYMANRQRFLAHLNPSVALYGNCATCNQVRMVLVPIPVFTQVVDSTGSVATGPGSFLGTMQTIDPGAAGSVAGFINLFQNANLPDSLAVLADSALTIYNNYNTSLCEGPIDMIINQLVNCADSADLVGVRNSLLALCNSNQVAYGNYTPQQIWKALTDNGISLGDICNPYLINYDNLSPSMAASGTFSCNTDGFNADAGITLNGNALQALQHLGTGYTVPLSSTNQFQSALISKLGVGVTSANVVASYNVGQHLYTLTFSSGSNAVKLFFKTVSTGICATPFTPSNVNETVSVSVECINNQFPGFADGLIGKYTFTTRVSHLLSGVTTACLLPSWNDKIEINSEAMLNPIAGAVPYTQMRSLYKEFWDTLVVYQITGADHPYYTTMLRNFMNYRLKKSYSGYQYTNFIESAALADSMRIPLYGGYCSISFTNGADAIFNNAIADLDTAVSVQYDYWINYGGEGLMSIDFNQIPTNKLRKVIEFINDFAAVHDQEFFVSFNFTQDENFGQQANGVFLRTDTSFTLPPNPFNGLPLYVPIPGLSGKYPFWNGSTFRPGTPYVLPSAGPTAYAANSYQAYLTQKACYENGLHGIFIPYSLSTVNDDYNLADKKAYLKYAYSSQSKPPYKVLDTLQTAYLAAGIPAFNGKILSYGHPAQPGKIENLYVLDPSTGTNGTNYNKLAYVLNTVKNYFDSSTGKKTIFFAGSNTRSIIGNNVLTAYRCADTAFWYRYFGPGDTLYNIFVRTPAYLDTAQLPNYIVQDFRANPGDGKSYSFNVKLANTALPDLPLDLNGFTDFVVAKNEVLHDVLLAHAMTEGTAVADTVNNCERQLLNTAIYGGKVRYALYIDSIRSRLRSDFFAWTMGQGISEQLLVGYRNQRFNYTLYYYDRAGNLARTVPPGGTGFLANNQLLNVDAGRSSNSTLFSLFPSNNKSSIYLYNSLNQVVNQSTPDGGKARFFYDAAGRLIFSQNEKQQTSGKMTYTLYDEQGRIVETGEAKIACPYFNPSPTNNGYVCYHHDDDNNVFTPYPKEVFKLKSISHQDVIAYVRSLPRAEVVYTNYDKAVVDLGTVSGLSPQENLRKRVSTIKYFDFLQPVDSTAHDYNYAMHFSYDAAGNVKTLTRDYPVWKASGQEYKRIDYDYDVISGKVNLLSYNRGFADQFFQRYYYDADNRVTTVKTSADGYIWKRDAEYQYYQHGPLARVSLGDLRVQGIDYAYTIQGWLKAINGDILDTAKDMGRDATSNSIHATDAMALSLDYFKGDYKPIGGTAVTSRSMPSKNMYNGNIPRAGTSIAPFPDLSSQYTYDQLNRLVRTYYANMKRTDTSLTPTSNYYSSYAYDADGNLNKLVRNGNKPAALRMDSLMYRYTNNAQGDNKLQNVNDYQANNYQNDIKQNTDQYASRYLYDATGNVIKDLVSGQDTIQWNHYNKVSMTASDTAGGDLRFAYDGAGNRYLKSVAKMSGDTTLLKSDYYVRDAQGNILAIYNDQSKYIMSQQQWVEYMTTEFTRQPCGRPFYINRVLIPNYGQNGYFKNGVLTTALSNTAWAASQLSAQPVSFYMLSNNAIRSNLLSASASYGNFYTRLAAYSQDNSQFILSDALGQMLQKESGEKYDYILANKLIYRPGDARMDVFTLLCTQAPVLLDTTMRSLKLTYFPGQCDKNTKQLIKYVSGGYYNVLMTTLNTLGKRNQYSAQYRSFLQTLYSGNTRFSQGRDSMTACAILCKFSPELLEAIIRTMGIRYDRPDCNSMVSAILGATQNSPATLVNFVNTLENLGMLDYQGEYQKYLQTLFVDENVLKVDDMQKYVLEMLCARSPGMIQYAMDTYGLTYDNGSCSNNAAIIQDFMAGTENGQEQFTDALISVARPGTNYNNEFLDFLKDVTLDSTVLQYQYYTGPNGTLLDVFQRALSNYVNADNEVALRDFYDNWTPSRKLLLTNNDSLSLLTVIYDANPGAFLENYVAAAGNYDILNKGLISIPRLSLTNFANLVQCCVMAVAPCTSTRIDTIIHNVMTNALKYQRINLASHVIYGSSRLGTKDCLPNQYYNLWDNQGPTIIVDTTQLNGRRPWYSLEYNDDIKGLYAEPWSNTDVSPFSVQHQVGQKQYELTNHLGNVQATVTDLPVLAAKTNDTIRQHHPALAAAYDYYPFGMLMPDRYVSDTSGNCLTVTQTKWVTTYETVCHDVYDWVWPNISVIALGSFTFNTKELFFTAPRLTDGIAVSATVVPHLSHTLNLDLDLLQNEASTTRLQVTELIDGNWKEIASTSLVKGRNLVTFIPSTSTITWRILGPFYVKVNTVCITQPVLSQQSVLVDICNTDKDKYRFGFNGQEKVNEWSGIGNFLEFSERGYDSRIGRFLRVDPFAVQYPWNSTFAFAENDVIRSIDLEGLEKVTVTGNSIKIEGVKIVFTERPNAVIDGKEYHGGNIPSATAVDLINKSYTELNKATENQVYKLSFRKNPVSGEILNAYSDPSTDKEYKLQYDIKVLQFKNEDEMRKSPEYSQALKNKTLMGMGLYGKDSYYESAAGVNKGVVLPSGVGGKAVGDFLNTGFKATLIGPENYSSGTTETHEDGHNMGLSHVNMGDEIGEMKGEYNSKGLMKGLHGPEPEKQEAPSNGMLIKMINTLPVQVTK